MSSIACFKIPQTSSLSFPQPDSQLPGQLQKIAGLGTMLDALQELADACDGDHRPECPILRDFAGPLTSGVGVAVQTGSNFVPYRITNSKVG